MVDPISSIGSSLAGIGAIGSPGRTRQALAAAGPDEDKTFGQAIAGAIDSLNASHNRADGLALQAATGDLTDVHEYTIAATEAQLMTELTVAVRDKAVAAFNDIMRMPI